MTTPTITMGARDFVASQQGDRKGSPLPRHEEPSP